MSPLAAQPLSMVIPPLTPGSLSMVPRSVPLRLRDGARHVAVMELPDCMKVISAR
jgi:hypothetical protein